MPFRLLELLISQKCNSQRANDDLNNCGYTSPVKRIRICCQNKTASEKVRSISEEHRQVGEGELLQKPLAIMDALHFLRRYFTGEFFRTTKRT